MSGRIISRAESWETVYQAFQNINFTAFDYQSIKQSMIDYLKLYFPETFNDFIESSEFIALLELFAYLGEIMAYRVDMASHENFLPTAQRKQSVLRLAKLISYSASRNIPARGLVKITSVSTTEPIYDSRGLNLAGAKVTWNDTSNTYWKDQFLLITNSVLKQPFGSVQPSDRIQVQDVLFELYNLNNVAFDRGVIGYSAVVSGQTYPMELVPIALNEDGPYEKRPEYNAPMTLVYGSDGLGDSSIGTGFFMFTKQGELRLTTRTFDGITPNQTFDLGLTNVNEIDVWVNNVDPDTHDIVSGNETYIRNDRFGEWIQVDLAQAQNIIYNTNVVRNKYEIETLENDDVRFIFGDGEFASIPSGLFHFWSRTSENADLVIPQSSIYNSLASFNYIDMSGISRTFSFTFSVTNTLQNAAQSEDIEHIRRMAPSVYYTQDRMVNGRDYNTFMLQDQTILKIRSFNRTFAGESNYVTYVTFNDPSGAYDNVKIFGDDLAVFLKNETMSLPEINPTLDATTVVRNFVEPILSDPGSFLNRAANGIGAGAKIRTFTNDEFLAIVSTLKDRVDSHTIYLSYVPRYVYVTEGTTGAGTGWGSSFGVVSGDNTSKFEIGVDDIEWTAVVGATSPEVRAMTSSNLTSVYNNGVFGVGATLTGIGAWTGIDGVLAGWQVDALVLVKNQTNKFENGLYRLTSLGSNSSGWVLTRDTSNDESSDITTYHWMVEAVPAGSPIEMPSGDPEGLLHKKDSAQPWYIRITKGADTIPWVVSYNITRMIAESPSTKFWFSNQYKVINYDSLTPGNDVVVVLKANTNKDRTGVLSSNTNMIVIGSEHVSGDNGPLTDIGLPNINQINVVYEDTDGDMLPNLPAPSYVPLSDLIGPSVVCPAGLYEFPFPVLMADITVLPSTSIDTALGIGGFREPLTGVITGVHLKAPATVTLKEYVYTTRISVDHYWTIMPTNETTLFKYITDTEFMYNRNEGRFPMNFLWMHKTPNHHLVDPAAMNIIDTFIVTRGYYISMRRWLDGYLPNAPSVPTPLDLKTSYAYLIDNKMISDSVILHSGKFKILFGANAPPELRSKFKVIRSTTSTLTDNQIKLHVIAAINSFFDITKWEFGETFYYTELAAVIHSALPVDIDSVVLVPLYSTNHFGDLFQVYSKEDELFISDVTVNDVEIISSIGRLAIKQKG
jgi:hypothetical protein